MLGYPFISLISFFMLFIISSLPRKDATLVEVGAFPLSIISKYQNREKGKIIVITLLQLIIIRLLLLMQKFSSFMSCSDLWDKQCDRWSGTEDFLLSTG